MNLTDAVESKIHMVLVDNILSFWASRAFDPKHKLPFGKIDENGLPVFSEPVGVILTARMLWAFSVVHKFLKKDEYIYLAQVLTHRLIECFWDQSDECMEPSLLLHKAEP